MSTREVGQRLDEGGLQRRHGSRPDVGELHPSEVTDANAVARLSTRASRQRDLGRDVRGQTSRAEEHEGARADSEGIGSVGE
ncbi:hypothetical protein ASF78_09990 [Cellulomonas sp. Leaf334]|nr:hypothetical protein ASF78_09990 [Cellulomonas sp. Leaf334]